MHAGVKWTPRPRTEIHSKLCWIQVRVRAGEGTRRAGNSEAAEQAEAGLPARAGDGPEADLRDMLTARDELMNRCCTRTLAMHTGLLSALWACSQLLWACLGACHASYLCLVQFCRPA